MRSEIATGAKLNLGLHVLRKRADGYHDIETVFLPIGWSDVITVRDAQTHSFTCSDPSLPVDESNLCVAARISFEREFGESPPVHIHLDKRLPAGSGLGGGSANAAGVLRLLSKASGKEDEQRLEKVARSLGADVPFFLHNRPCVGVGKGDELAALRQSNGADYRCPFVFLVAVPELSISSADAYRLVAPSQEDRPDLESLVRGNDIRAWRDHLVNDFEAPIFSAFPQLARLKGTLYGAGAEYASLSGSGAAVFGVFPTHEAATAAAEKLGPFASMTWIGESGRHTSPRRN